MQEVGLPFQPGQKQSDIVQQLTSKLLRSDQLAVKSALEKRLFLEVEKDNSTCSPLEAADLEGIVETEDISTILEAMENPKSQERQAFLNDLRTFVRPKKDAEARRDPDYWRAVGKRATISQEEASAQLPEGAKIFRSPLQGRWFLCRELF